MESSGRSRDGSLYDGSSGAGLPVRFSKSAVVFVWNASVKGLTDSIKRSHAVLRFRYSLATR